MVYLRSLHPEKHGRVWPPGIVLVHGFGVSGRYMLPLAAYLAVDHPVFLRDLPGFGDSSHPPKVPDVQASPTGSRRSSKRWR